MCLSCQEQFIFVALEPDSQSDKLCPVSFLQVTFLRVLQGRVQLQTFGALTFICQLKQIFLHLDCILGLVLQHRIRLILDG